MEKENKYYTPSIDEFHVGFKYQELDSNDVWVDKVFYSLLLDFNINYVRVKYLDKEDIESLGWKLIFEEVKQYSHWCQFKKGKIELHVQLNEKYFPRLLNMNGDYIGNLRIKIKNKSELKKLINQLNIQ
jgi:hypothetical protein